MGGRIGILVWLAVAAWLTAGRAYDWQDEQRLWQQAHEASPEKPRPLINLGAIAVDRDHDHVLGRWLYERALDGARRRGGLEASETELIVRLNLILLKYRADDLDGARADFLELVSQHPKFRSRQYVEQTLWPSGR